MKKRQNRILTILFFLVLTAAVILAFHSCRSRTVPDDFNIAFQFGTSDENLITMDTYNHVITKGADQKTAVAFTISEEDRDMIYNELCNLNIKGYNGEYYGSTAASGDTTQFSMKFTVNKRTNIVSGNGTTLSYQKRNTKSLIEFRDFIIAYIKKLPEYRAVAGK